MECDSCLRYAACYPYRLKMVITDPTQAHLLPLPTSGASASQVKQVLAQAQMDSIASR